MGLFSVRRPRTAEPWSPIRLHSEYSAASALARLRDRAVAAANDARVLGALLVLAAAALAFEMAVTFHL